jgi:hypothetical protein
MSTVLFSKTFIQKINTIIKRFWWAGIQEEQSTTPIAYRSWDDICKTKEQGGLGIRDMELINKSLLIQSAWNVATNKNPFLSSILKAKKYPNNTFWTAPTTLCIGLPFCRSNTIYILILSCRSMPATLPFGPPPGLTYGHIFMNISFYL